MTVMSVVSHTVIAVMSAIMLKIIMTDIILTHWQSAHSHIQMQEQSSRPSLLRWVQLHDVMFKMMIY